MSDREEKRQSEMVFFKTARTLYVSALDDCGDINKSLAQLKKSLAQSGGKMPAARWARLDSALRTGEIVRGKKSTPGDWAAAEIKR